MSILALHFCGAHKLRCALGTPVVVANTASVERPLVILRELLPADVAPDTRGNFVHRVRHEVVALGAFQAQGIQGDIGATQCVKDICGMV